MSVFNKNLDFFLIKFPIIFPIMYMSFLFSFPDKGYIIAFVTLLLLGEPHFGATWTMFFEKKMRVYAKKNYIFFYILPVFLVVFSIFLFFYYISIFYFLFFGFNIYHVTRQSIGISKLYSFQKAESIFQEYSLYFINSLSFFGIIGFHMMGFIDNKQAIYIGFLLLILSILIFITHLFYFKKISQSILMLTGLIMFIPAFFVDKPIHALLAGVTMHYVQYLSMTFKLHISKNSQNKVQINKSNKSFSVIYYIFLIFIYGVIATSFTTFSRLNDNVFSYLIIIPILGQILHFYIDGLVWKYSDKELREINLNFLIKR